MVHFGRMKGKIKVTITNKCVIDTYEKETTETSYLDSKDEFLANMRLVGGVLPRVGYSVSISVNKETWTFSKANDFYEMSIKYEMTSENGEENQEN